jgi:hypothetical protein
MRVLLLAVVASLLLVTPAAAAPTWLPPVDLGAETTQQSIGRVALGADGTAVAAWAQVPSAGSSELQVARRQPGQAYGAPITVPGTTGVESRSVRVGVDGAGNATVLYRLGGAFVVMPWPAGAATPAAKQPLQAGSSGELAVGRGGTAVATWIDNANVNQPQVRAAVRPAAGGDFGAGNVISSAGNGQDTINGLRVAVGDSGHATVVWSRVTLVPNVTPVEANERAPGGDFSAMGTAISPAVAPDLSSEPAVAVDPSGRSTVLWTRSGQVRYAEHAPSDPLWSTEQRVSPAATTESMPAVAAAPSGAVIAAWVSNGAIQTAARPAGGGAFAGFQTISGPAMNTSLPQVAAGGNGDALISWSLGDGKAIPTIQRRANGTFGPLLTAVNAVSPAPGENLSFDQPSIGIDDEGNGVAAWTRTSNRNATDHFRFQTASFDAAAPTLTSSVPPGAERGAPIGMAAAASDRVSPVAIAWNFGDGSAAAGGAVSHAFASAGAFNVTVTATDAAGNQTSQAHPVLVAAPPPPPPPAKKRITSPVGVTWALRGKQISLVRLLVQRAPKGTKAQLRCSGKKCPFKRIGSKKRRKGTITLFKAVKATKALATKKRNFRGSQRLELRITAKGYIGKVVRYKLKTDKIPVGQQRCLPIGAKKPRKRCA